MSLFVVYDFAIQEKRRSGVNFVCPGAMKEILKNSMHDDIKYCFFFFFVGPALSRNM